MVIMMDDETEALLDLLMADGFVLTAFMIQVSLELARLNSNPKQWAEEFISNLHSRVDRNESVVGIEGLPLHELARRRIDVVGHNLTEVLSLPRE